MNARFGWPAALFSLKCFAGGMLALFVAFSIGLERPYWAFITAYIVAQPMAGAVISKGVFRVIGSIVGGGPSSETCRSGRTGMIGSGWTNGVRLGLASPRSSSSDEAGWVAHALSPCWVTRYPAPSGLPS